MRGLISGLSTEFDFDVIVIGAGINGAGIARDAALRGLKVLLLDKGDLASGTSSWSTRLIHGGLRYLEHGEFGLVRESLRERENLLTIAPHLVHPLELVIPNYAGARRGRWLMRAGMLAYDALSVGKQMPRHCMISRAETIARLPGLNPAGLLGAAVYFDAQVEFAERLVVEIVLSAISHGATVMTYARVYKIIVEAGIVKGVEFTSTSKSQNDEEGLGSPNRLSASASIVINAAGPWVDELLAQAGPELIGGAKLIGGTKGSHLILAPFPGAPASALYVEAEADHRPFFIIPWNQHYLIGTTDIRFNGDLDNVRIDQEEIDYLLRETNRVIPSAGLSLKDVLYTYSGVRPLPSSDERQAASITRRHFIRRHPHVDKLVSIVGGKLTTYRSLAEETVDQIFAELKRSAPACLTSRLPLPGAETTDFAAFRDSFERVNESSEFTTDHLNLNGARAPPPAMLKSANTDAGEGARAPDTDAGEGACGSLRGSSPTVREGSHLLRVYGTRARKVQKLIEDNPALGEVFDDETGAVAAEVVFAFREELAQTLADCLLRRTMVGLNSSNGLNAVTAAAKIGQQHLGWTDERRAREVLAYRNEISRKFRED